MANNDKKKGKKPEEMSLIDKLTMGILSQKAEPLNIIEFIEQILDNFDLDLFPSQKAILKAIYGLPMDDDDLELLMRWKREEKTNWMPNDMVLAEINAERMAQGKPLRKSFKYSEIVLQCGMRSGKSSTVGLIAAYEFYRLVVDPNPQKTYNLPSSSIIYISALASSERQTLGTIFGLAKTNITGSTFFQHMISRGEISVSELQITCPAKNIIFGAGHSKADTLVGRTAKMVAFDELAMFSADDGKTSNAADVYSRVGRSTSTFNDDGLRVAMSSVKEEGDFMQRLVDEGWDQQMRGTLIFDLSTFDFNPTKSMDDPQIAGDYARDPIAAQRDYENLRPSSSYAYINPLIVDAATRYAEDGVERVRDKQENVIFRPLEITRVNPSNPSELRVMSALEIANLKPIDPKYFSIGHADPGSVRDSFGFACGHPEVSPKGIVTVIDIVLEWLPKELGKGKRAPVDYLNAEEILIEICKARKVTSMTFDQFDSQGFIQSMFRAGIPTKKLHFAAGNQFAMYECLRLRLNQGLVKIPNHETLVEELKNLEINSGGTKVSHPKNKDSAIIGRGKISKDLADCIAVVNWHIAGQEKIFTRDTYESFTSGATSGSATALRNGRTFNKIDWGFH